MNEQKDNRMTEWDIRLMAWHEAGHAVCSFFLPETETIQTISIEPENDVFGAMRSEPRKEKNLTYISCINEIATAMAGRISEEMFCKEITSSCIHDLNKIQFLSMQMVCKFGMGRRTGLITWISNNENSSLFMFSEKQCNDIYEDIKDIIIEAEKQAREILENHSDKIALLVEQLLTRKTIYASDLSNLLRSSPITSVC